MGDILECLSDGMIPDRGSIYEQEERENAWNAGRCGRKIQHNGGCGVCTPVFVESSGPFGYLGLCLTRGQMMGVLGKYSVASGNNTIPCRIYSVF